MIDVVYVYLYLCINEVMSVHTEWLGDCIY